LDHDKIASCSHDKSFIIWSVSAKKMIQKFVKVEDLLFRIHKLDEDRLAMSSAYKNKIYIYSIQNDDKIEDLEGHTEPVRYFCDLDKEKFASCAED